LKKVINSNNQIKVKPLFQINIITKKK
jgi:hypothetical protein